MIDMGEKRKTEEIPAMATPIIKNRNIYLSEVNLIELSSFFLLEVLHH